jgi:hypothetical protein
MFKKARGVLSTEQVREITTNVEAEKKAQQQKVSAAGQ